MNVQYAPLQHLQTIPHYRFKEIILFFFLYFVFNIVQLFSLYSIHKFEQEISQPCKSDHSRKRWSMADWFLMIDLRSQGDFKITSLFNTWSASWTKTLKFEAEFRWSRRTLLETLMQSCMASVPSIRFLSKVPFFHLLTATKRTSQQKRTNFIPMRMKNWSSWNIHSLYVDMISFHIHSATNKTFYTRQLNCILCLHSIALWKRPFKSVLVPNASL